MARCVRVDINNIHHALCVFYVVYLCVLSSLAIRDSCCYVCVYVVVRITIKLSQEREDGRGGGGGAMMMMAIFDDLRRSIGSLANGDLKIGSDGRL